MHVLLFQPPSLRNEVRHRVVIITLRVDDDLDGGIPGDELRTHVIPNTPTTRPHLACWTDAIQIHSIAISDLVSCSTPAHRRRIAPCRASLLNILPTTFTLDETLVGPGRRAARAQERRTWRLEQPFATARASTRFSSTLHDLHPLQHTHRCTRCTCMLASPDIHK